MLAVIGKILFSGVVYTQKHIAARVTIKSPANDAIGASRSLRHNVRHDVLQGLTSGMLITDDFNSGSDYCQLPCQHGRQLLI